MVRFTSSGDAPRDVHAAASMRPSSNTLTSDGSAGRFLGSRDAGTMLAPFFSPQLRFRRTGLRYRLSSLPRRVLPLQQAIRL